jgi:hypothetical protein
VVADCGSGCLPRPRPPHGRPTCTGCRIGGACGSSIYLSQSRFAVLGLGDYTFSPYKIAISGLQKQWRRGAWDRLESLLRATASATPPSLVALSSSPSRGVAKTVAAMGAGLSAWPPACRPFCSVSDMTGAMPQPRRDTFTEFPAREGGLPDSQDCRAGTEVSRRSVCAMGSLAAFAEDQMAVAASTAVNRRSHCQVRRGFPRSILLSKPPDLPTSRASAHSVTQRRRRLSRCGPVSGVRAPRGMPRWSEEHGGRNSPT